MVKDYGLLQNPPLPNPWARGPDHAVVYTIHKLCPHGWKKGEGLENGLILHSNSNDGLYKCGRLSKILWMSFMDDPEGDLGERVDRGHTDELRSRER